MELLCQVALILLLFISFLLLPAESHEPKSSAWFCRASWCLWRSSYCSRETSTGVWVCAGPTSHACWEAVASQKLVAVLFKKEVNKNLYGCPSKILKWEITFYNRIPCCFIWVQLFVFSLKLHCDRAIQCETNALFCSVSSRISVTAWTISVSFGISKVTVGKAIAVSFKSVHTWSCLFAHTRTVLLNAAQRWLICKRVENNFITFFAQQLIRNCFWGRWYVLGSCWKTHQSCRIRKGASSMELSHLWITKIPLCCLVIYKGFTFTYSLFSDFLVFPDGGPLQLYCVFFVEGLLNLFGRHVCLQLLDFHCKCWSNHSCSAFLVDWN